MLKNKVFEYKMPLFCFLGIAILHLSSLNVVLGFGILIIVLYLSSINPLAFIVTGVGAQLLPYPLDISIQFAQLQIFFFLFMLLLSGNKISLNKNIFSMGLFMFCVIGTIVCLLNETIELFLPIITGIFYFIIVGFQLQRCTYSMRTILTVFVASTFLAGIGFWSSIIGIETVSEFYEANSIRDIVRMGSGNVDANSVGITIPIGVLGLNALLITSRNLLKYKKKLIFIILCIFLYGVPVIFSTGSRTSILILSLGYLILLIGNMIINKQIWISKNEYKMRSLSWYFYFLIGIMAVFLIYYSESAQKIFNALQNINSYEQENYSSGIASGRNALWLNFGEIVLSHPFFGCPAGFRFFVNEMGIVEFGTYQAHNTYLEVASLLGIPLAILFFSLFFRPILYIKNKLNISQSLPIFVVSLVFFISFFAFSAHSWKLFYMFLAILAVYVDKIKNYNTKIKYD